MTRPTDPGPPALTPQPSPAGADATKEFSRPRLGDPAAAAAGPAFHVGLRGYDRRQVDTYRSQVEAQLGAAREAHELAARAHAETTERLRAAQGDLARLRTQLTNSPSSLPDRLREILDLAAEEAHETRTDAQAEAEQIRTAAQTESDQLRARASNDAQVVVREARKTAEGIVTGARTEQQRVTSELEQARDAFQQARERAESQARQAREQADAEARRAREQADAAATAARDAADAKAKAQRDEADSTATARLAEINRQLVELTRHRDEAHIRLSELHRSVSATLDAAAQPSTR